VSPNNSYYLLSILEAAWKLNDDLSLAQLVHNAASRVGIEANDIFDCDDKQLVEGLHRLIIENNF
jgi:uncharacterized protein YihD (DUF1040 family)